MSEAGLGRWVQRRGGRKVVLSTDEHPVYVRGLARVAGLEALRRTGLFEHRQVSGKVVRNKVGSGLAAGKIPCLR